MRERRSLIGRQWVRRTPPSPHQTSVLWLPLVARTSRLPRTPRAGLARARPCMAGGRTGIILRMPAQRPPARPGRNDPCPCGSGKKYKHCCLLKHTGATPEDLAWRRLRRTIEGLDVELMRFARATLGAGLIDEAWRDFTGAEAQQFDPETVHLQVFLPWFFYGWTPDPADSARQEWAAREQTVAQAFLAESRHPLDALARRYLQAATAAAFSFHDVLRCDPGRGMRLRDILMGTEHEVIEHLGSQTLQAGDIVLAQVITVEGLSVLDGMAPFAIPPRLKAPIVALRETLRRAHPSLSQALLRDYDLDVLMVYHELAEQLLHPRLPELCNTEGDPLVFQTLHFDIDSPQAAFDALKTLALEPEDMGLLQEAQFDAQGALAKVAFPWQMRGNPTQAGWSNTVLGHLRIEGRRLIAEVNSGSRAERIRALIEERLGGQARYRTTVVQSAEALWSEDHATRGGPRAADASLDELNARPEVQAALGEMLMAHYADWARQPLPALKDRTPLEAICEASGREVVEGLLIDIERSLRMQVPGNAEQILAALRERLGLP
jgi:hypothetical protein